MTESETLRYARALSFAAEKHGEQRRRNETPYILHPIKVAMKLADEGYDVRYQIVGLFHDLLEDTDATETELREFCDDEMIEAIKRLTKEKGYKEEVYINGVLNHPMAKAVKNADRIDNLYDLCNQDDERFWNKYMTETQDFFYGRFSKELDDLFDRMKFGNVIGFNPIYEHMIDDENDCKKESKMVKHVILWTLKDEFNQEEKDNIKAGIKEGLEGLMGQIPGLLEIKVNTNGLASSNADLMLDSTFESEEALKGYAVHPAHVAVADGKVRPYTASRVCLDHEVSE